MLVLFILGVLGPPLLLAGWIIRDRRRTRALAALSVSGVDEMTGDAFERLVASLLARDGYRVRRTGKAGDMGVDIIAAGYAIQAKRYTGTVGVAAIQEAHTGAAFYGMRKHAVVTSGTFTRAARQLAWKTGTRLIDRQMLASWLLGRRML